MEVYDEILAQERAIQRHRAVLKRQQGEMKERSEKILAEMEDNLQELQKKKAKYVQQPSQVIKSRIE
eukprot:m.207366 g.207366  ORF g.207366 m.207366 type:complete len:67 (+) comp16916_c0_seq29:919-1119(+)